MKPVEAKQEKVEKASPERETRQRGKAQVVKATLPMTREEAPLVRAVPKAETKEAPKEAKVMIRRRVAAMMPVSKLQGVDHLEVARKAALKAAVAEASLEEVARISISVLVAPIRQPKQPRNRRRVRERRNRRRMSKNRGLPPPRIPRPSSHPVMTRRKAMRTSIPKVSKSSKKNP